MTWRGMGGRVGAHVGVHGNPNPEEGSGESSRPQDSITKGRAAVSLTSKQARSCEAGGQPR